MTNKKKVLLTGSAGFICSNFIRKAIYEKQPYTFVSVDKITRKENTLGNIYKNKDHPFYLADITDSHIIDIIFESEKPEIVINFAAETAVDNSLSNANLFITSNVLGTQVLINAALKYGVERFVQISTDEVLGHLTNENDLPWNEEALLNPRNPYSASKASAELLIKAAHQSHGLNYNITRSSNNYGPWQTSEKLLPKVIKCILNNESIPVFGTGSQIRDWTYVRDNNAAILAILEKGKLNETYNISANQEITNIELIQKV